LGIVQLRLLLFPVTKVYPLKNKIEKEKYQKYKCSMPKIRPSEKKNMHGKIFKNITEWY